MAEKLIKNKKFTWNSGIFVFKTSIILKELARYSPLILKQCTEAISKSNDDLDFVRIDSNSFSKSPNLPIDIAVMEKTELGIVIS